jgi:hypothetical protein
MIKDELQLMMMTTMTTAIRETRISGELGRICRENLQGGLIFLSAAG